MVCALGLINHKGERSKNILIKYLRGEENKNFMKEHRLKS